MGVIIFSSLGGVILVAISIFVLLSSGGRRHFVRLVEVAEVREPLSNVKVLTTAEQIGDSAWRAAAYERAAALNATERAVHYETVANEQLSNPHLGNVHSLTNDVIDEQRQSA